MKQDSIYTEVKNWIYRNARPLELARWQYHFEESNTNAVLDALSAYQNEDGGFGHALECDSWNPNSSSIQTFHAIQILSEINFLDRNHPIIQGVLKYLDSGIDFNQQYWSNTIPSNNDYPHAPWWHSDSISSSHHSYNPTAGLAGFALYFADKNSSLYHTCMRIAAEALDCILKTETMDMHALSCYITLLEYCEQGNFQDVVSLVELRLKLKELVKLSITRDTGIWATSYVCKPSQFMKSPKSLFYTDNQFVADYECDFIINGRNSEGVWDVTWGWEAYPEEWAISKNWWKGHMAVGNMLYLKNFDRLI